MLTEGYLGSCVSEGSGCTLRALGSQKRAAQIWLGFLAEMLDQGAENVKHHRCCFNLEHRQLSNKAPIYIILAFFLANSVAFSICPLSIINSHQRILSAYQSLLLPTQWQVHF